MSATLLIALFLGAPRAQESSATATAPAKGSAIAGADLCEAIHQSLRRWARPADPDVDRAAREFLQLSADLRRDTQIAGRTRLELQTKLRYRLAELSARIRDRVARDRAKGADAQIASVKVPDAQGANLAQAAAGPAGGPGAQGFGGQQQPGAAAAADDNGQMLVDLIQKTIAPESWEGNGGPGTIYYWRPGRALVINQTDDVHDLVGGLLGQMQNLGH
jgi:hypothetical protein